MKAKIKATGEIVTKTLNPIMKARIKKTGEIVNLADYAMITLDQCDSWGNPIELKPEEVELIQDITEDEHWQDVRERAAIAAMQGLLSNRVYADYMARKSKEDVFKFSDAVSEDAVEMADALVEQLKKKEH